MDQPDDGTRTLRFLIRDLIVPNLFQAFLTLVSVRWPLPNLVSDLRQRWSALVEFR